MVWGIPNELVYDQDNLIVVSENAGDLILTAEFEAYRRHRNLTLHVCRKADPESKEKIENVVGFIKHNFAKHRIFTTIDAWNEQGWNWLRRTANGRVHNTYDKKETGRCVRTRKSTLTTDLSIIGRDWRPQNKPCQQYNKDGEKGPYHSVQIQSIHGSVRNLYIVWENGANRHSRGRTRTPDL